MHDYQPVTNRRAKKRPEFIKKVKQNIRDWDSFFQHNNDKFHTNMDFVYGQQWGDDDKYSYKKEGKQPITINMLYPIAIHIVGEQLQNTPQMSVKALTDDVHEEEITLRERLLKKSALENEAKVAYQVAYHNLLCGGFGVLRVTNYYQNKKDLKQNFKVEAIPDPTNCFFDKDATLHDKSDGMFCGYRSHVSKEWVEDNYNIKFDCYDDFESGGCPWVGSEKVVIVDYMERKCESKTVVYLTNGLKMLKKDWHEVKEIFLALGYQKIAEREIKNYKVNRYKIVGDFIVEEYRYPSQYLGYIFCDYDSYIDSKGDRYIRSFFENAHHAQKRLNQYAADISYLASKQKGLFWSGHPANISKYTAHWEGNNKNDKFLPFEPYLDYETGQVITPTPHQMPNFSTELLPNYNSAQKDIYLTTGVYQTQIGEQGQEHSGRAIEQRAQQGNMAIFKSLDSLNRSISRVGCVVLDMMGNLWTQPMKISLPQDNGKTEWKMINKSDGMRKENDMSNGEYNVIIEPSSDFEIQRQNMTSDLEAFMKLTQAPAFAIFGDKLVKAFPNLPYRDEIMQRVEQMLAPEVKKQLGMKVPPQQPNPEEIKIQLEQAKLKLEHEKLQNERLKMQHEFRKDQVDMQLRAHEAEQEAEQKRMEQVIDLMKIKETEKQTYMRAAAEAHKIDTEQQTTFQKEYLDMYKKILEMERKYQEKT